MTASPFLIVIVEPPTLFDFAADDVLELLLSEFLLLLLDDICLFVGDIIICSLVIVINLVEFIFICLMANSSLPTTIGVVLEFKLSRLVLLLFIRFILQFMFIVFSQPELMSEFLRGECVAGDDCSAAFGFSMKAAETPIDDDL